MLRQQEDWVVRQGKEERQGGDRFVLPLQEARTSQYRLPNNEDKGLHVKEAVQKECNESYMRLFGE